MKKICTLIFSLFLIQLSNAQCVEDKKTKILLIGDSWAFFKNVDGALNTVAKDWGHSNVEYYTNLTLSENGAETDDFLKPSKVSELTNRLTNMQDLKVVHLSIGGNDFLGEWKVSFPQYKVDSLYNSVVGRLDSIIDTILQIRPDIHIFWSGYTYTNFEEIIGSLPSFLQSNHPFYTSWQKMEFPTILQINTLQNWFQEKIRLRYAHNPKFTYVPASAILQYTFGQQSPLQVAPNGTYPAFSVSLPEGNVNYPSPIPSMRNYVAFRDCFHLSSKGHYDFVSYHFQKFYHKFLMKNEYTIADFEKTGSVSNNGNISNELKIGQTGSEKYVGIIHLDNSHFNNSATNLSSIYLQIEEIVNANIIESRDFEIDIINGFFGNSSVLDVQDYYASASISAIPCVFGNNSVGKWIRLDLPTSFYNQIKNSPMQIRMRYTGNSDAMIKFKNSNDMDFQVVLDRDNENSDLSTTIFSLENDKIFLYPNPTNDLLNIVTEDPIKVLEILSITGQKVMNIGTHEKEINVSELQSGIYFLNVEMENQTKQIKFVKQ